MEFVKTGNEWLPDGTLLYGYCVQENGGMPVLDSVESEGMDIESRQMLLKSLQSTFEQFDLPHRRIKTGDSFSHESPLSIPVADVSVDMNVSTKYELIEIRNDTADFEVTQTYTMTSTFDQLPVSATGNGDGRMYYLISKNFYSMYRMDITMEMGMEVTGIILDMKTTSGFIQKNKIERKRASR